MPSFNEVEQNVANELFLRHNMLLGSNGTVEGAMIGLALEDEWTSGGWMQSRRNGKVRVTVGGLMSTKKTGFRELKKGGFNYDKIADKLVEKYNGQVAVMKRRAERENRSQDYDAMIQRAVEKHGVFEYGGTVSKRHSKDYTRLYGLEVTLKVTTNEQIDALLYLAKELGISIR